MTHLMPTAGAPSKISDHFQFFRIVPACQCPRPGAPPQTNGSLRGPRFNNKACQEEQTSIGLRFRKRPPDKISPQAMAHLLPPAGDPSAPSDHFRFNRIVPYLRPPKVTDPPPRDCEVFSRSPERAKRPGRSVCYAKSDQGSMSKPVEGYLQFHMPQRNITNCRTNERYPDKPPGLGPRTSGNVRGPGDRASSQLSDPRERVFTKRLLQVYPEHPSFRKGCIDKDAQLKDHLSHELKGFEDKLFPVKAEDLDVDLDVLRDPREPRTTYTYKLKQDPDKKFTYMNCHPIPECENKETVSDHRRKKSEL